MAMRERIIVAIFFLLLGFWLVHTFRPKSATYLQTEYKHFWIEKTHNPSTYNFLICGDSRIYRGISCNEIQKHISSNYRVFNFGFSSGSYSNFMLDKIETKIDTSSEQAILLLGITPYSLTPRAAEDGHINEELTRKKEEIFEYRYLIPIKLFFEPFTPDQLFNHLRLGGSTNPEEPIYYQEFYPQQGWVASWKVPIDSTKALKEYEKDFASNTVDSMMVKSLVKRVDKWVKQGILVFAFRPPTTNAMVSLEDRLSGFNENTFKRAFEEAGGRWINVPVTGYVTYDGSHLERQSALKLSSYLGLTIAGEDN
jgi:hypothetical protein